MARKKKKNLRKAQFGFPDQVSGITGMINLGDSINPSKFPAVENPFGMDSLMNIFRNKQIMDKLNQIKNLSSDSSNVVIHENPDINRQQSVDYLNNIFDILTKKKGGDVAAGKFLRRGGEAGPKFLIKGK
jgi:hypothetical protein